MNRPILVCTLFVATAAALGAQQASQASPYEGVSRPPADDQIITTDTPEAKPRAGQLMESQPVAASVQVRSQEESQPGSVNSSSNLPATGDYNGMAEALPQASTENAWANNPDGDIVHARPRRAGEIGEGTTIRVRLLERLSTGSTEKDEPFHTRVASDVLQGGRVVIPAGSEIDGRVVQVSRGHAGGHGSMRLAPEMVVLPNGSRFQLHAEISGTPGSSTRVGGEGTIRPASRLKRDGIEYGGAVGVGLVAGALIGGPGGAAAGSLIGAGVVTVHLLVSHPQATLESGTTLMFTLTEPVDMIPGTSSGN